MPPRLHQEQQTLIKQKAEYSSTGLGIDKVVGQCGDRGNNILRLRRSDKKITSAFAGTPW